MSQADTTEWAEPTGQGLVEAPLGSLSTRLRDEPGVMSALGRRSTVLVVPEAAHAFTLAGLLKASSRSPFLVATPTINDAERLAVDLRNFIPADSVELFPAWETLPFERVSPSVESMGQRLRVLWRLRQSDPELSVVIAPIRALSQRLVVDDGAVEPIRIEVGSRIDLTGLVEDLVHAGYRREYQVEHRGEISVRGSIIDIFPATADAPVRVDLWGDDVERLTEFSAGDQRSTGDLESVLVFPARELVPRGGVAERAEALLSAEPWGREQWQRVADGESFEGMEAWLPWLVESESLLVDEFPANGQIILVDPRRLKDRADDIVAEEADLGAALSRTWDLADGVEFPRLHLPFDRILSRTDAPAWTFVNIPDSPDSPIVTALAWPPAVGEGTALTSQLRQLLNDGFTVIVCADGPGSAQRINRLLGEHDLGLPFVEADSSSDFKDRLRAPGGRIVVAPLERGCILPELKLAFLAEADLSGRRRTHREAKTRRRTTSNLFEDLKIGDHVVHHVHGVGRFQGMVKRSIGDTERDYLLLEYRGGDKLYVPSDQIETIRLYSGGETPRLNKMGGADFSRTKAKVRSAVAEIAQELVVLYQKRVNAQGHAFGPDTPWQREMEMSFPFQETTDQLNAIAAVKEDMESTSPMDRLICGDVGFGKTEVALRAVFKAVQDGFQVAVLVPTTLLAQQHYQTFSERLAGFPIRVEQLSRFLTPAQSRGVMAGLAEGEVDIVIGTHKLLSKDIRFKKLGLLVVDEEQRFGVSHKELIKQLKANVDVLTLSATPIPRTLEMSLTGIRDMSLLNTPPAARQPILTYVGEYDERAVTEAIRRELLREGQVFYVHNRVRDIELHAARLRELVPEARIAVAHGQMDEGTLERVVVDFWQGEFDVLVCTTIIESGIDMPTVNTLVVERSDLLGLGQLHQLRGRVGRAGQRAYAYLFYPRDTQLTEEAYERLKTIGEATQLGSGFRIAMRDLEIRGAGNLLGTGQSGHVAAVGYDLYVQMVNEAIDQLSGREPDQPVDVVIELPFDAFLPGDYVERDDLRLDAYRRLAAVTTQGDVDDIAGEWSDRYGAIPAEATALLEVARVRAEAVRTGVRKVTAIKVPTINGGGYMAHISPIELTQSKQIRLGRLFKGAVWREQDRELRLPVDPGVGSAAQIVDALGQLVASPQVSTETETASSSTGGSAE